MVSCRASGRPPGRKVRMTGRNPRTQKPKLRRYRGFAAMKPTFSRLSCGDLLVPAGSPQADRGLADRRGRRRIADPCSAGRKKPRKRPEHRRWVAGVAQSEGCELSTSCRFYFSGGNPRSGTHSSTRVVSEPGRNPARGAGEEQVGVFRRLLQWHSWHFSRVARHQDHQLRANRGRKPGLSRYFT